MFWLFQVATKHFNYRWQKCMAAWTEVKARITLSNAHKVIRFIRPIKSKTMKTQAAEIVNRSTNTALLSHYNKKVVHQTMRMILTRRAFGMFSWRNYMHYMFLLVPSLWLALWVPSCCGQFLGSNALVNYYISSEKYEQEKMMWSFFVDCMTIFCFPEFYVPGCWDNINCHSATAKLCWFDSKIFHGILKGKFWVLERTPTCNAFLANIKSFLTFQALLSAVLMNNYVGTVNQVADVEIDKVFH